MTRFDTSELRMLAADLTGVSRATAGVVFDAIGESAVDLRDTWARNATQTAGKHGRHYPKSITVTPRVSTNVVFDVGPDPRLPQGGMSFEFGSQNQPAHLDGQIAMDEVTPRMEKRVADALAGVFQAAVGGKAPLQEYTTKSGKTRTATAAQIANWTRGSR